MISSRSMKIIHPFSLPSQFIFVHGYRAIFDFSLKLASSNQNKNLKYPVAHPDIHPPRPPTFVCLFCKRILVWISLQLFCFSFRFSYNFRYRSIIIFRYFPLAVGKCECVCVKWEEAK